MVKCKAIRDDEKGVRCTQSSACCALATDAVSVAAAPLGFLTRWLTEDSSTWEAGQVEMKSTSSLPPHFQTGRLEQVTSASRASAPRRTLQDPAGWGGHSTCLRRLLRGLRRLVQGECLAQCQDCRESHIRAMLSINYDCSNSPYHH